MLVKLNYVYMCVPRESVLGATPCFHSPKNVQCFLNLIRLFYALEYIDFEKCIVWNRIVKAQVLIIWHVLKFTDDVPSQRYTSWLNIYL